MTTDKLVAQRISSHLPQDGEKKKKKERKFKIAEGFVEGSEGFGCYSGAVGSHEGNLRAGQYHNYVRDL